MPNNGAAFDLDKFSRICGLLGSAHEGERTNALALGSRMLEKAGRRWEDFVQSARQAEVATAAAAELLAENTALKAELDQLRGSGTAVAVWSEVGAKVSDTRAAALWGLDLHRRGELWLSDFEVPFLQHCSTWTGQLTPKMAPIFRRIIERVCERTGQAPPA